MILQTDVLKMNLMYQCGENVPDVVEKIVPPPISPPALPVPVQVPPIIEDDGEFSWRE